MYGFVSSKFPYLELRLFLAIVISIIMIIADEKLNVFLRLRNYIENSIYLLHDLCDQPHHILSYTSHIIKEYHQLALENHKLRQELFLINSELLLIDQYKRENCKLHALLNSPLYCNQRKIVARVLCVNTDLYSNQVIINLGKNHDVYIGQPVITDTGVVGQVISSNILNSRVMLLCDPKHALPVQIKRNNIRFIIMGSGYNTDLHAEYPSNIDVCVGDVLVTSGLDGCFPEGYPVATVSKIIFDMNQDCTVIQAHPIVELQCLRHVILIWE